MRGLRSFGQGAVFLSLFCTATASGQSGPELLDRMTSNLGVRPREHSIRVDVNLVLVPVTVTDRRGRVVSGLDKDNFTVFEDKAEQPIVSFNNEDAPISVGLLVDLSGSMRDKMSGVRLALRAFLRDLAPEDETFLMTFADRPEMRVNFTSEEETIENALLFANAGGSTALIDAVYLALGNMRSAHNARKAVLIISDGGDNHSRYSEKELRRLAQETDVQIHAIGIHDNPRAREEMEGPRLLEDLAQTTGGLHFIVRDVNEMDDIAAKIGLALHDRYVLGYRTAPEPSPGKWRKIQVKVTPPKGFPPLQVYARAGYYSPSR